VKNCRGRKAQETNPTAGEWTGTAPRRNPARLNGILGWHADGGLAALLIWTKMVVEICNGEAYTDRGLAQKEKIIWITTIRFIVFCRLIS
jgi:hypothetical protein